MWTKRLDGCSFDVDVWGRILSIRQLVVSPQEDVKTWMRYSSLARQNNRLHLAINILKQFGVDQRLDCSEQSFQHPEVHMAYLEHLNATGQQQHAFQGAQQLIETLALLSGQTHSNLGVAASASARIPGHREGDNGGIGVRLSREELLLLKAQCHTCLGTWQMELKSFKQHPEIIRNVLTHLELATTAAPHSYTFWCIPPLNALMSLNKSHAP